MSTLVAKRVDKSWKYEITVDGHEIPFIYDAEVVREGAGLGTLIIKIVIGETSDHEVIIEE
jgi:hypothetical protein